MIAKKIIGLLSFFIVFALVGFGGQVQAQEEWIAYKNKDKLFQVRVPSSVENTTSAILVGDRTAAFADYLTAIIPSTDADTLDRIHTVKFFQTLGSELTPEDIDLMLERKIGEYLNGFSGQNGKLIKRKTYADATGLKVGDLHFTYNDEERGPSHMRTRIYLSSLSGAVQSVSGSESSMFSYRSKDFFESMTLYDGYMNSTDEIADTWTAHTSPFKLFTAFFPKADGLYVTQDAPVIKSGSRSEVVGFKFHDPFLNRTLAYNVYGHKFKINLSEVHVTKVLQKMHLQSKRIMFRNSAFVKRPGNVIEAVFSVNPTEENGYATYGKLVAQYDGSHMIVHEIYGTETLVVSNFVRSVMDNVIFHPERADEPDTE